MTVDAPGETPSEPAEKAPRAEGSAFLGSLMVTAGRAFSQVSYLVLFIIAARILTPAELAAFGLVTITVLVLQHAGETAWYERTSGHSRQEPLPPELFWFAGLCGVGAIVLGLCIAAGIAVIGNSPKHAIVMAMLSALAGLAPMICVQSGVLARQGRMAGFGAAMLIGEAAGLAVGIYGLLAGWNIFALAAQRIVTMTVMTLTTFALARFLPPLRWRAVQVEELFRFYLNLLQARAVSFVNALGGDYLTAIYLGLHDAGIYRAGNRFAGSAAEMLSEPARIMAWSILPTARQGAAAAVEGPKAVLGYLVMVLALATPVFFGLILVAEPLVQVLLGPGWEAAAVVLTSLAAAKFMSGPLATLAYAILGMDNQFRAMMRFNVVVLVATVGPLAAVGWMGFGWVLGAQLAAGMVIGAYALHLCVKHGGVKIREMVPDILRIAACAAVMAGAVLAADQAFADRSEIIRLAAMIAAGAVAYCGAMLVMRPEPVVRILAAIRRRGA